MPTWNAYTRSPACHHTSRMFHALSFFLSLCLFLSLPAVLSFFFFVLSFHSDFFHPRFSMTRFCLSHLCSFIRLPLFLVLLRNLFLYFLPQSLPFAIISTDTSPALPRATYGTPRGELASSFYSALQERQWACRRMPVPQAGWALQRRNFAETILKGNNGHTTLYDAILGLAIKESIGINAHVISLAS